MTTIDEIMQTVFDSQAITANYVAHKALESEMVRADDALRDLITAALADAERRGAEAMREAVAAEFDRRDGGAGIGFYDPHEPAEIIRAMHQTAGSQS